MKKIISALVIMTLIFFSCGKKNPSWPAAATATPTAATASATYSATAAASPSFTVTGTASLTFTETSTPKDTATATTTHTYTSTFTDTVTYTITETHTITQTYTNSPTITLTATPTDIVIDDFEDGDLISNIYPPVNAWNNSFNAQCQLQISTPGMHSTGHSLKVSSTVIAYTSPPTPVYGQENLYLLLRDSSGNVLDLTMYNEIIYYGTISYVPSIPSVNYLGTAVTCGLIDADNRVIAPNLIGGLATFTRRQLNTAGTFDWSRVAALVFVMPAYSNTPYGSVVVNMEIDEIRFVRNAAPYGP